MRTDRAPTAPPMITSVILWLDDWPCVTLAALGDKREEDVLVTPAGVDSGVVDEGGCRVSDEETELLSPVLEKMDDMIEEREVVGSEVSISQRQKGHFHLRVGNTSEFHVCRLINDDESML